MISHQKLGNNKVFLRFNCHFFLKKELCIIVQSFYTVVDFLRPSCLCYYVGKLRIVLHTI